MDLQKGCLLLLLWTLCAAEAQETIMRRRERDTVTLHTGVTDMQKNSQILWYFGLGIDDLIAQLLNEATQTEIDDRFRGRLELDTRTGSLTIRNLNIGDSGVYRVHKVMGKLPVTEFQLIVYKPVAKPEIQLMSKKLEVTERELMSKPQTPPLSRSSSSRRQQDTEVQSSSCRVLCLVENDRDVILSWTRGEESLNWTSSSHLNTTLSLLLDIEDLCLNYTCIASNPVSKESVQVNMTICSEVPCFSDQVSISPVVVCVVCAVILLCVLSTAVFVWKKRRNKSRKMVTENLHLEEPVNSCNFSDGTTSLDKSQDRFSRLSPSPAAHQEQKGRLNHRESVTVVYSVITAIPTDTES